MATFQEIYALRFQSANLRERTTIATANAAQAVIAENPATANHANRLKWAHYALVKTIEASERMLWPVVTNASIQNSGDAAPDSDIQWQVNQSVDVMADAYCALNQ